MLTKREIRLMMKSREKEFLCSGAEKAESERILLELEQSREFREAGTVLAYMSIPGEVCTVEFMARWYGRKRMLIPLVTPEGLQLREYGPDRLVHGYAGILEPALDAPSARFSDVDFALVPGIAFSLDGLTGKVWRLGRGKAYYDRLLDLLECPVAGLAFPFRLIDRIPVDPWDKPLDMLFR